MSRPNVPAGWRVFSVLVPEPAKVVYEIDRIFGNKCDPHVALARSESREGPGLRCGTCGKRAEGNYSDDAGPVCDACIEAEPVQHLPNKPKRTAVPPRDGVLLTGVSLPRLQFGDAGDEVFAVVSAHGRFLNLHLPAHLAYDNRAPTWYYGREVTDMINDPMSTIEWDGPAETWTTPLTPEQIVRLTTRHAMADDQMIAIVAFGPERPDCISTLVDRAYFDEGDPGDTWQVRFGRMPLAAYQNLPEHEGW